MTRFSRTATNSARLSRHVWGIALVTPILLLAMALASNGAYAKGSYYYADPDDGFEDILEKYPSWPDTNRCAACHKWQSPSSANLNLYGLAFENNKNLSAIAGIDSDGDGVPNGNELQAKLLPGLKTAAPTGLAASDDDFTDKVHLTWSAVPTPSGWNNPPSLAQTSSYKVYRATAQGGAKTPLAGTVSAPSYDDTTAIPGTNYYYWVRATSPGGQSEFSSPDQGRRKSTSPPSTASKADKARLSEVAKLYQAPMTKAQADLQKLVEAQKNKPPPPTGLKATDGVYPKKVRLTWNAATNAAVYRIFRKLHGVAAQMVEVLNTNTLIIEDATVKPGKMYRYAVRACNQSAKCSDIASFDTGFAGEMLVVNPFLLQKALKQQQEQKPATATPAKTTIKSKAAPKVPIKRAAPAVTKAAPVVKRAAPVVKRAAPTVKKMAPARIIAPAKRAE